MEGVARADPGVDTGCGLGSGLLVVLGLFGNVSVGFGVRWSDGLQFGGCPGCGFGEDIAVAWRGMAPAS